MSEQNINNMETMTGNKVIKQTIPSKAFHYSKGEVKLDFALRTNDQKLFRDFADCLRAALKDIEEELKNES